MHKYARLISIALLSLGLITGCATSGDSSDSAAAKAIAAAKASNAEAKALNYEWRDTGKIIAQAEKELADGNEDAALALANKAKAQADTAIAQANFENKKYLNGMSNDAPVAATNNNSGRVSSYSVTRGDSLWGISGKSQVYNNPYQWPLIYKTNRDKIKDADLIHPGQVFDIDQNASASEIDAAVNHAKTRGAWSVGDVEQSDRNYLAK